MNNANFILDELDIKHIEYAFEQTYFFAEPEDLERGRYLTYKNRYTKLLEKINGLNELAKLDIIKPLWHYWRLENNVNQDRK